MATIKAIGPAAELDEYQREALAALQSARESILAGESAAAIVILLDDDGDMTQVSIAGAAAIPCLHYALHATAYQLMAADADDGDDD